MRFLPAISWDGGTSTGSADAPITISVPFAPKPPITDDIAFPLGAVARIARAAEFLQLGRGVGRSAVDINIRSQRCRERSFVRSASDCGDAIAEFLGELNSEMAESADALDGDKVAGERRYGAARGTW
jgi:hypothetical protein